MDAGIAIGWVEDAIDCSLPTGPGQRHQRLFRFVRMLKSLPDYREAEAESLKPIVREWWRRARPVVVDKDWLITWGEFLRMWKAVRYPWGEYVMTEVVEAAIRAGCPAEVLEDCDGDPSGLAAAICRELARREEGQFYLDCRTLGRHIGVAHGSAATILREFCRMGLLRLLKRGTRGRASEYEYLGEVG